MPDAGGWLVREGGRLADGEVETGGKVGRMMRNWSDCTCAGQKTAQEQKANFIQCLSIAGAVSN